MNDVITSLRLSLLSLVICSALYPAIVLCFASLAAPQSRQGSLIHNEKGTIVGSRLLAQNFTRPEYFWPRPSACDYNASATAGSNLSPTNPKLADRAKETIARLQPGEGRTVPADLVTASGSGMDPNITLSAALFQSSRVAAARNMSEKEMEELIRTNADTRITSLFGGEPLVNVLDLNIAMDKRGISSVN